MGCVNNPTQEVNDSCESDFVEIAEQRPIKKDIIYSSSVNGKTAIGNLKFGINKSSFKRERTIFLKNFPTIADMEINDVMPIFDNGILISIIIHSKGRELMNPNSPYYVGGHDYDHSSLVKLYDEKYSGYKKEEGYYLKNGISYRIFLGDYLTPKNVYKLLTNQVDLVELLSDKPDLGAMGKSYYTGYDYLIISNQIYLDSLQTVHNKGMKDLETRKSKKDYDAI